MPDKIKMIDERERQKNTDRKKKRSGGNYSESVKGLWFRSVFKTGFVQ